uniref:LytS signal transduction histidine kinase n=1 Tax=uncultured organism TaxID=155900 RepID=D8VMQ2_9ZZZZ|nr:LytS signal transduction histidine kinase [uncultured organism]
MRWDSINKLQNALHTWAFCLAIATLQYAFQPDKPYAPLAVYSLAIGSFIWAFIDLGRHFIPSAAETGWPTGLQGSALMAAGILAGYFLGTWVGDALCHALGWHSSTPLAQRPSDLRNSLLITLTAGIAGTYYFYTLNKSAYLQRKMVEADHLANEARLKLLETQLEPHMLFNTLANLRALIAVDPERAQTMLDHMIAYLRATLSASRAGDARPHTLQDEFARLRDYLELMAIRMGPRLQFTLELPDALAAQPVPALLLQPLVENSIQHGLEPQVAGGHIAVRASQQGALLCLDVIDTGQGLAPAQDGAATTGRSNFGLQQVRERLAAAYGPLGALKIVATPTGGTAASVTFPLKV